MGRSDSVLSGRGAWLLGGSCPAASGAADSVAGICWGGVALRPVQLYLRAVPWQNLQNCASRA